MRAILYDDRRSYLHTLLGFVTPYLPLLALIFTAYEIAEYFIVKENKDLQHTIGDFCEYSLGIFAWCLAVAVNFLFLLAK